MSNIFVNQIHGAVRDAFVIFKHLARMLWTALRLLFLQMAGCTSLHKLGKWRGLVSVGVLGAALAALAAVWLDIADFGTSDNCPAPPPQAKKSSASPNGPVMLLSKAHGAPSLAERTELLEQCLHWKPQQGAMPPLEEVRAQLECHAQLVSELERAEAPDVLARKDALAARSRSVLGAVRGTTQRCEDLTAKLKSFTAGGRGMKQNLKPSDAIVALGGLSGFENIAKETFATLQTLTDIQTKQFRPSTGDLVEDLDDLSELQASFRGCMVKAVREARVIASSLPLTNGAVARVQRCRPTMLLGVEELALTEAEKETSSIEVLLSAGLLLSEKAVAPSTAPFFSSTAAEAPKAVDAKGLQVPASMARAENLLFEALKASPAEGRKDLAKQCLMRLAKHAKSLAEAKNHAGAEWRYAAGADLAKAHGHDQMASSALAQLSYFLALHGRYEEALAAASEALKFNDDALAAYLQVSLRLSLGELRTDAQVEEALEAVRHVKGKLPAEHLEGLRGGIESHLESWQEVSAAGTFASCFRFGDAAFLLSCILGRIAFV